MGYIVSIWRKLTMFAIPLYIVSDMFLLLCYLNKFWRWFCLFSGWLSDVTGSYHATFYTAGAGICLSGMMLFAIPWLRVCDTKGSDSEEDVTTVEAAPLSMPLPLALRDDRLSIRVPSSTSVPELLMIEQHESVLWTTSNFHWSYLQVML